MDTKHFIGLALIAGAILLSGLLIAFGGRYSGVSGSQLNVFVLDRFSGAVYDCSLRQCRPIKYD